MSFISSWQIYENRQERQIGVFLLSVYFFSNVAVARKKKPIYQLRLHWRKADKKKSTYLSFLPVFLICLAMATLEKSRQEK